MMDNFVSTATHEDVADHEAGVMVVGADDGTGRVERVAHEVHRAPFTPSSRTRAVDHASRPWRVRRMIPRRWWRMCWSVRKRTRRGSQRCSSAAANSPARNDRGEAFRMLKKAGQIYAYYNDDLIAI